MNGKIKNRKDHTCRVGDKVLLKNEWKTKFNQDAYKGLCTITAVRDNVTVRVRKGRVTDTYNLCNIIPYKELDCIHHGGICHTQLNGS